MVLAQKDSQIKTTVLNLGAQYARVQSIGKIIETGANVQLKGISLANKKQLFDHRTFQSHIASNGKSDVFYKNVLLDEARTIFEGMIKIGKNAKATDAYQTNRNLLLSEKAQTYSLPQLEIANNDVRCSHGSTSSGIDPVQHFYLRSRGLSKEKANELLVLGFLEQVLDEFEDSQIQQHAIKLIEKKFTLLAPT